MAKQFFTERDIEELAARGEKTLQVTEEVILTELAYEKAEKLGVRLLQAHQLPPAAPVRPYLSQPPCACTSPGAPQSGDPADLRQRIRDAVTLKLGAQVDPQLLDTIITRVLNNVGMK